MFFVADGMLHGRQGIIRTHSQKHNHDLAYDEAFENDSSNEMDSPRSNEGSYGAELHEVKNYCEKMW